MRRDAARQVSPPPVPVRLSGATEVEEGGLVSLHPDPEHCFVFPAAVWSAWRQCSGHGAGNPAGSRVGRSRNKRRRGQPVNTTRTGIQAPIRKDRGRTWKERLYIALAGAFALAGFALSTPYMAARRVIGRATARRSQARNRSRERSEGRSETHRTTGARQSHEKTHQAGRMRVYRLSSDEDAAAVAALASSAEEREELRVVVAAAKDGGAALIIEHDERGGIRKAFHESGRQLFGEIDRPSQPRGLPLTRETVENGERIIETFHADGRCTTRKPRAGRVLKSYPIYEPDTAQRHSVMER